MSDDFQGIPKEPRHPRLRRLRNVFLAGLAAVIPLIGTGWLLILVFKALHTVGVAIINGVLTALNALRRGAQGESVWEVDDAWSLADLHFPGDDFLWLLIPLALLFLMGLAVTNRPGRKLLNWLDGAMTRVPLMGFFYSALKQFVDAVQNLGGARKFKGVAYVEYPSPGCRLIGFVTGNYYDPQTQRDVTTVFIPTAPNPMTGFVVIMDDDKVYNSEMSLEEAGKMIISAGLVAPGNFGMEEQAARKSAQAAKEAEGVTS
ncbi:MAG: DUF502 domain-containing protein [Verrucomicrobiales bacterium]